MRFLSLTVAALALWLSGSAHAEYFIAHNNGGTIGNFIRSFDEIAASGEEVRISGTCLSACTLILRLPAKRICVEPGAKLGFHQAWEFNNDGTRKTSELGTALLMAWYPPPIRRWIGHHGGLKLQMMTLEGTALHHFYRPCRGQRSAHAKEAFAEVKNQAPSMLFFATPINRVNPW